MQIHTFFKAVFEMSKLSEFIAHDIPIFINREGYTFQFYGPVSKMMSHQNRQSFA